MSPINFAILSADHPELTPVWDALARWFEDHPRKTLFEVESLAELVGGPVGKSDIATALWLMARAGALVRVLKLRGPGGDLLPGDYPSRDAIPETVGDRLGRQEFNSAELALVPCYRRGAAHVSA